MKVRPHRWRKIPGPTFDLNLSWSGFTTYLERVLQGEIHGAAERDFSYIIGRKSLSDALKRVCYFRFRARPMALTLLHSQYKDQPKYQRLVIPYTAGEDPDDAYSTVPYEKGSNFLLYLGKEAAEITGLCSGHI